MSSTQPLPIQLITTADDPLVGKTVGGYIVEHALGEGGMGLVYRARHPILNRHFAIKVLRPEVAGDALVSSNFIREAQTLSSLKHPHIIDIVGFGPLEDGRQFMVMEFVQGSTLQDELEKKGQMTPTRALLIADEMLDALSAAHSVDVIHRDLKPSNVFLAKVSGGTELVKLLDFGLAKQQPQAIFESGMTAPAGTSVLAGTPEYIAPEQALGQAASKQSDLYSFGVMLYEMLTGVQPFLPDEREVDRIRSVLHMHIHQAPPTIAEAAHGFSIPHELEEIVADLLKKHPQERPFSADTVRSRLQRVYRSLQQEATHSGANPLLNVPEPRQVTMDMPAVRLTDTEKAILTSVETRRWPVVALVALLALLLLAGGWWWSRRGAGDFSTVVEIPIGTVHPVAVAAPVPVPVPVPAPAPAPVAAVGPPKPAAEALTPPPMPAPEPKPTAKPIAIGKSYHVEIHKTGCVPSDRWRASARASMQEIQQNAAALNDRKAWQQFESAEPAVSGAIGSAVTGVDCDAVELQIQKLASKFKH